MNFADETEIEFPEDIVPEEETVPESDTADWPKPSRTRVGSLHSGVPVSKVLLQLTRTSRRSDNSRPPVFTLADGETPIPFVCPVCRKICRYGLTVPPGTPDGVTVADLPEKAVKFLKRSLCVCEQEETTRNAATIKETETRASADRATKAIMRARSLLILPPRLARASFDNYDIERSISQKSAYQEARKFAELSARYFAPRKGTASLLPADIASYEDCPVPAGLLLKGKNGVGKSHLTSAIARYLIPYGITVRFENVESLLTSIRDEIRSTVHERQSLAETANLLILDDLGMEHVSATNPSFACSTLYKILDYRYQNEKPTLISTNLSPDRLMAKYGDHGRAILSRISGLKVVVVVGPDGRSYQAGTANE